VNWRNLRIACRLAERCGVTTVMLTGKGEPTLFPGQITKYLQALTEFQFPIIELQSNGILLAERADAYAEHLRAWYDLGLTTIAVSVVHYLPEKNRAIYLPHRQAYVDLPGLIQMLHNYGFSVRLACILADGFIDSRQSLQAFIAFAQAHRVEQVTVRPVNRPACGPSNGGNGEAHAWVDQHHLGPEQLDDIRNFLDQEGALLMTLVHGARVYDVGGQNVCLTDSLTIDAGSDDLRQLIFCPDGHLRYDWQYSGAILL
jgi:hypothetical protein